MAGRLPDSGYIDLPEVFRRVQAEMLAHLSVGQMFEHSTSHGHASEQRWLELFQKYLPKAYKASPAFIVNAAGERSHQIDIAIYDALYSPPLFPHASGVHVPIESVYAVFEVKASLTPDQLRYAGDKAQSVRKLYPRRDDRILAGVLSTTSAWTTDTFRENVCDGVRALKALKRIDLGCTLDRGAFEWDRKVLVSVQDEALIFFTLRLIERLTSMGPRAPVDLRQYMSTLKSFQRRGW